MRLTIEHTIEGPDEDVLLGLYRASIEYLAADAVGVQAYTDDEFRQQLHDPAMLKLVGRDGAGVPQALCLVTDDLSNVPWVSAPFYAKRFPDHYARGAILYVATIVVQPDAQATGYSFLLMKELARMLGERDGIGAFDCCGVTQQLIPDLAERVARRFLVHVERQELDSQRYYAVVTEGIKPGAFGEEPEIDLVGLEEAERAAERVDRR